MMKLFSIFFMSILCFCATQVVGDCAVPSLVAVPDGSIMIVDKGKKDLPKNFRTLFHHPLFAHDTAAPLRASGSAQPTLIQFQNVFAAIRSLLKQHGEDSSIPLYIVDLRLEPHGYYGNELVTIYETGLWENFDALHMETYEQKLFHHLRQQGDNSLYRDIVKKGKMRLARSVEEVSDMNEKLLTEKEYVKTLGGHYVRLAVRDHTAPTLVVLKQFFEFMETLPDNAWVHFHCSAGRGRTSTFLFLYELYKRRPSKGDTFESMAKRHTDSGSIDFFDDKDTFQKGDREKRLNLLRTAFKQRQTH